MTGKHHRAWYLCGFKLHSLVVRDVEAYGLTCYFYIIFGKYMFMSSCFLIAFLISIIKCTQPNLPLILFVCGMSVYVCICQPQMRKSEDNHGYGSLPSGLLEAASLVVHCRLLAIISGGSPISTSPLSGGTQGLETWATIFSFYMGSGCLNSGSYASFFFLLPTESSPQPLF